MGVPRNPRQQHLAGLRSDANDGQDRGGAGFPDEDESEFVWLLFIYLSFPLLHPAATGYIIFQTSLIDRRFGRHADLWQKTKKKIEDNKLTFPFLSL